MQLRGVEQYKQGKNTGKPSVEFNPAITIAGFLIPTGDVLTAADLAEPMTTIRARLIHDDPSKRWHLVGPFESFDDKSEAAQSQTLGYGKKIMLDRGIAAYEYTYLKGGMGYHQMLMAYHDKQANYQWLPFDANDMLRGCVGQDTGGNLALAGLSLSQIFVHSVKEPNRSTVAEYRIALAFDDIAELNEDAFVVNLNYDVATDSEAYGVKDVEMTDITPGGAATGVFILAIATADGDLNLAGTPLGVALAATGAWFAINTATGAAITVSSVALNGNKTGFVVTLDHTDTDYTVDDDVTINIKAISVLAGLGVKYYESEGIVVIAS